MNKETKQAKESIRIYNEINNESSKTGIYISMKSNEQTCQRWLEFLEVLVNDIEESIKVFEGFGNKAPTDLFHLKLDLIVPEMKDKEQAIKIYEGAGI